MSSRPIDDFIQDLEVAGKSPVTIMHYKDRLMEFERLTGERIKRITPTEVRKFLKLIRWRKPENYNLSVTALRKFIRWAKEVGSIEQDFSEEVGRRPKPETNAIWLTPKEVQKLLENCQSFKQRLAISFLVKTGIRRGRKKPVRREFCGLTWADFDFENKRVKVHGKGHGVDGRIRWVNFDDKLKSMLFRYKKDGGKMPIYHYRALPRMVRAVARRAGLKKIYDAEHPIHIFRHTFCTNWIIARRKADVKEDVRGLSSQVGASIATLERTYIHIADELLAPSYDETMKLLEGELP